MKIWEKIEEWQQDYNENRPHSSLGNVLPEKFAALDHPKEADIDRVPETVNKDF